MASVRQQTSHVTRSALLGRAVLAVVLAFAFWAYVQNGRDPDNTRPFSGIAIGTLNTPPGLAITNVTPNTTNLTIWGPNSIVAAMAPSDVAAIVDLKDAKVGTQSYPVRVTERVKDIRKRRADPASVQVTLEQSITMQFPVTIPQPIQANVRVNSLTANPQRVTISGPESRVNAVAQVVADFSLGDRTAPFTSPPVEVKALDGAGNPVTGITFDNSRVTVAADIADLGTERTVPVNPNVTGAPAPGFYTAGITAMPPQVTLVGDPQLIRTIPNVPTAAVDISGAQAPVSQQTALGKLPDGVSIKGNLTSVQVQVSVIEQTQDRKFNVPIQFVNLKTGLQYSRDASETTLTLRGTKQQLDSVGTRITVTADLAGFMGPTGATPVKLDVQLPPDSGVTLVGQPETPAVQVTITAVATPTPVPTATPRPTATPTPAPTATPRPTATPGPIATAVP